MDRVVKKTETESETLAAAIKVRRPRAQRDRLNFRIDARIKQRAEEAALLLGQDLSTFAETALDEKAQAIIAREERLLLSERDFSRFMTAIDNPQPINAKLSKAAQKFKAISRESPELNW